MGWMDRWAAHLQRKSDARQARWLQRRQERVRSGQLSMMERWATRAQRKASKNDARWRETERLRQMVPRGPVAGPGGSTAAIRIDMSGFGWLPDGPVVSSDGGGGALIAVPLLITWAVWWLGFHRSYTVHVRVTGHLPKVKVRFPDEVTAYRAAARLVSRFQAEGPIELQRWRSDVMSPSAPPAR